MPQDDAHFVILAGTQRIDGREYASDRDESFVMLHRLCNHCYEEELASHAAGERNGSMRKLKASELETINRLAIEGRKPKEILQALFGKQGLMQIKWDNLPIPEEAYEIGEDIDFHPLLKRLKGSS